MISIFTPVNYRTQKFLVDAHASLLNQTFKDWEWVRLFNDGAKFQVESPVDERVRNSQTSDDLVDGNRLEPHNRIGRLKHELCALCRGDILVELDADDILTPTALEEIARAFEDPKVAFVYSNSASFDDKWNSPFHSAWWGWRHREFHYHEHKLVEQLAWPPSVHSFRRIEFAPNHVRAWRTFAYWSIGGHNRDMISGDDYDLMARTYIQYGEHAIRHIDKCLYLQRVSEDTASTAHVNAVQTAVGSGYINYIYPMVKRWAWDQGLLLLLDAGGGLYPAEGFISVDLEGADFTADLNKPWPFADNRVGVLRASHLIEHLSDVVHFFNEAFRVLAPGGWLMIEYPHAEGKGAFRDPTHKQFLNEQTMWYFTQTKYAQFIRFKGRFQASRVDVWNMEPGVPVVSAELIAVKGDYAARPVGEVLI